MIRNFVLGSFLLAVLSGCAWTIVKPIAGSDRITEGFRYYDTKPLLVVTDSSTQVIFVPNYSRAYAVKYGAFLSKHDVKLTIADGAFFKEIDDKQDPTELVKGLVALGQEAMKSLATVAKAASEPISGKLVAMYEFNFDSEGNFIGLTPIWPK